MNRQTLAEATSLHDGPVPVYLMEEIANSSKASARDAEKIADYMLGRLNKSNLNVKLKALQIISFCIREGGPAFTEAVREEEQELSSYLQFSGPPDPVYGDEKYRRIRVASQEALVCLNDGFLSRRNEEPPQQQQQQQQTPQVGANTWQAPQQGDNAPSYNGGGTYNQGGQPERQHSNVGGSWGQPQASGSSFRPPPYQDTPAGSYNSSSGGDYNGSNGGGYNAPSGGGYNGPSSGGYNGPPGGGNSSYGGGNSGYGGGSSSYGQNGGNSGGYGYNLNSQQGGYAQNAPQQQASGFDSWSSSSGSGLASKSSGAGVWSSTGYQKKDPAADNEPRYNPATKRDNRPTVLVGHALNFPKPAGGFGTSNTGATSGLGGFNSGTYNPNAVRGASAGTSGGNSYNPNAMGGSARGGFGGHQSGGAPSYGDSSNRMSSGSSHRIGSMGLPVNGQPLNDAPTTALGKKAEVLKKMGTAALEKWDRRNMDKSMASSLADHDELRAGPQVIDHGYYQPNAQQGAGGGDTSRDYERTMIDNLCAPAGLSRAPPADGLKRFVDLAQTLDAQTIGDILLDKLEDDTWQVRLKGLHVVLALLGSPGAAPYQEFFEENVEVVEELRKDGKPSVVSKALQVLRVLGYADEADQAPPQASSKRPGSTRTQRGSPTKNRVQQPQQEVDLLGFGSLSLESSAGPVEQSLQGSADLLGSPVRSQPPPAPAPPQEISLLDGFDTLGSSTSSNPSYAQQQPPQYYQQPEQDERTKALSHFGKDLFAIANSPRSAGMAAATALPPGAPDGARLSGGQSAFNFM
ncbi:hypothetical protein PRIC1_007246 [Phytophthora ramorum]|uniref:ENTH domain-containing protein n=1 Tax=Phytophthora ramorum TaxID=164328 RepID=H3GR04_PHYRM